MFKEIPICKECGKPMVEVGEIGEATRFHLVLEHAEKLYQCPKCKTVAIN